jgi:hypothetical protein
MKVRATLFGAVAVLALCLTTAGALAAQKGGKVAFFVSPGKGATAKILLAGAIGDYGTTTEVDQNGKVDANNGNYQKVVLQHGGFWLDARGLAKALAKAKPVVNTSNCSVVFAGSGPGTIFDGTGAYKGLGGVLKINVVFAGVAPRFKSGPHKGQCNLNANPAGAFNAIDGTGKVTFS